MDKESSESDTSYVIPISKEYEEWVRREKQQTDVFIKQNGKQTKHNKPQYTEQGLQVVANNSQPPDDGNSNSQRLADHDLDDNLFIIDTVGDEKLLMQKQVSINNRTKKDYPIFTPTVNLEDDEEIVYMSYREASQSFGNKSYKKNKGKGKQTIETFHKNKIEEFDGDLNDYFMNIKDGMTPEEIEEFLTLASMRLSDDNDSLDDQIDDYSSMDSDDYWNGNSDDSLSLSDDHVAFKSGNALKDTTSKSEQRKLRKNQNRATRALKRQTLKDRLETGKKTTEKLYKSKGEYENQIMNILTKTNNDIKEYIDRADLDSFIVPPLPEPARNFVRKLATSYNLKPKIRGNNQNKILILYLTQNANIPLNWKELPRLLVEKYGIKPLNQKSAPPRKEIRLPTKRIDYDFYFNIYSRAWTIKHQSDAESRRCGWAQS